MSDESDPDQGPAPAGRLGTTVAVGGPRPRLPAGLGQGTGGTAVGASHRVVADTGRRRLLCLDEAAARRLVAAAEPAQLPGAVRTNAAACHDRGLGRRHASPRQRAATDGSVHAAAATVAEPRVADVGLGSATS